MPTLFKFDSIKHANYRNYLLFFIVLFATIVLPGLLSPLNISGLVFEIMFMISIIVGAYVSTHTARELTFGLVIGTITLSLFLTQSRIIKEEIILLELVSTIFAFIFFTYLFMTCIKQVIQEGGKKVDQQTIFAAFCGYLIIGVIATILFNFAGDNIDQAFNVEQVEDGQMLYFAFITMTSIGYGDISPKSQFTQSLAIGVGISAQIYMTTLIAILVGKFVANSEIKHDNNED